MPKKNIILFILIVAVAATIILGFRPVPPASDSSGSKFRDLSEAVEAIKQNYYRDIDDRKLMCDAVGGMVEGLDEFSTYIPPDRAAAISDRLRGIGSGLGLSCEIADGKCVVRRVLGGSPAYQSGIVPGDQIVAIAGVDATNMAAVELERAMTVSSGQELSLLVLRRDKTVLQLSLKSRNFAVESVDGFYRDSSGKWVWQVEAGRRIGYVAINEFINTTVDEFHSAMRQMDDPESLIIDLRGNPGGFLPPAVELVDMFVDSGMIVAQVGRDGSVDRIYAHSEGSMGSIPVIILADGRTASAAEIVAGAMQSNGRAIIIGSRTRGKGCIQTPFELPGNLGRMNITTRQFLIGDDKPISRIPGSDVWGIEPDIELPVSSGISGQIEEIRSQLRCPPPSEDSFARKIPSTLPARLRSVMVTTLPADDRKENVARLKMLDVQLSTAIELLSTPGRVQEMLKKFNAARSKTSGRTSTPATTSGARGSDRVDNNSGR